MTSIPKIFIAYARRDKPLLDKLRIQLAPLQRNRYCHIFWDGEIIPGEKWDDRLKAELHAANLFILLVTPDFLASDYINEVELPKALEQHRNGSANVIPIILRDCLWEATPLEKFQVVAKNGVAIEECNGYAFAAREIFRALQSRSNPSARTEKSTENDEDADWEYARASNISRIINQYLQKYPSGKYRRQAVRLFQDAYEREAISNWEFENVDNAKRVVLDRNSNIFLAGIEYEVVKPINDGEYNTIYQIRNELGLSFTLRLSRLWNYKELSVRKSLTRYINLDYEIGQLECPFIQSVYFKGNSRGNPYLVNEYFKNGNISTQMNYFASGENLYRFVRNILTALNIIHQNGYIHRNLNPKKVLVNDNYVLAIPEIGFHESIKVNEDRDFAYGTHFSRETEAVHVSRFTQPRSFFLEFIYIPPVDVLRWSHSKKSSAALDIYSFGTILFELLSYGNLPFGKVEGDLEIGRYYRQASTGELLHLNLIPSHWRSFIKKCLSLKPADRYQSIREVAEAAEKIIAKISTPAA